MADFSTSLLFTKALTLNIHLYFWQSGQICLISPFYPHSTYQHTLDIQLMCPRMNENELLLLI